MSVSVSNQLSPTLDEASFFLGLVKYCPALTVGLGYLSGRYHFTHTVSHASDYPADVLAVWQPWAESLFDRLDEVLPTVDDTCFKVFLIQMVAWDLLHWLNANYECRADDSYTLPPYDGVGSKVVFPVAKGEPLYLELACETQTTDAAQIFEFLTTELLWLDPHDPVEYVIEKIFQALK